MSGEGFGGSWGGYGPQPGGFGPPPGMQGSAPVTLHGGPLRFAGTAGALVAVFLIYKWAPAVVGWILNVIFGVASQVRGPHSGAPVETPAWLHLVTLIEVVLGGVYAHELLKFEWGNLEVQGRRVRYTGSLGGFVGALLPHALLTGCTLGFAYPWLLARYNAYAAEHCEVDGAPLRFNGNGGDLFGRWLLGTLLSICTLGIYGAWLTTDIWAWTWENTEVGGRRLGFRRDPAGLLGELLLLGLLSVCTAGIYWPWAVARLRAWEVERVQ